MPSFLALIPSVIWRWIAILGVGIALYGYGYLRGFLHEEHKFSDYQAKVNTIGEQAAVHVAEVKRVQNQTTKEVRENYANNVVAIEDYYRKHPRVVRVNPGCGPVPAPADSTSSPDGTAGKPSASGPDLEQACALDAARINAWRDFALKNHFPIE